MANKTFIAKRELFRQRRIVVNATTKNSFDNSLNFHYFKILDVYSTIPF